MTEDTTLTTKKALSIKEAHHTLGVGKTSLYAMISRRELETIKIGRRHLVLASSIDALIERSALTGEK